MIIGIGIDLVDSQRIEKLRIQHANRFFDKYFTDNEKQHVLELMDANQALSLAKRWAAKEACAKALGCGFRDGIVMKDMDITNDKLGKPSLTLTGHSLEHLKSITPNGKTALIHLSLTDEAPYAQAQVIIEAI